MKSSYKYVAAISGLSFLASCSEDRMHLNIDDKVGQFPITLFAAYPTATRASDAGFEDGDRMGVFVLDYSGDRPQGIADDEVHASNVGFSFNESDNTWKSASNIYWTSKNTPADIIGYYPYVSDMQDAKSYSFSIQRRQDMTGSENAMGGYEASDFLWAKAQKAMPTDSRVDLTFNHKMAGVRITLSEGKGFASGEWAALEKSVLIPNIKSTADIDLETGTVSSAYGDVISVSAYRNGEDWRAVVVPQTISAGENVIDITVDGVSYHLTKQEALSFVGGKLSTFTIAVDKRDDGKGYEFKLSDEAITAWVDDVEFRDGIVRNYLTIDVEKRGTLKKVVEDMGLSNSKLVHLKLTGEIDEVDFEFLREECSALRSLNLVDVTSWFGDREFVIPEYAMATKSTLSHIVFPKNLKVIGSSAFAGSGLMGSLILPEGIEKIGEYDWYDNSGGSNTVPSRGAFDNCTNLFGELHLPSTVVFIEEYAFGHNQFSGQLQIPESVKIIGNHAFEQNSFTGDLILPDGIERIGVAAFAMNQFSGRLVLPGNIKTILSAAFQNSGFTGVLTLPDGLTDIEKYAFDGCNFKGELVLPSSLQRVSNRAFSNTKISSVVFSKGLRYLGDGAFMNCKNLRGPIELPEKMQRVNEYLFCGCNLLTEITIPKNVMSVGAGAFYGCSSLNKIVCNTVEPPMVSYLTEDRYEGFEWTDNYVGPFDGLAKNNFTLEVPKESIDLYKVAEGWKEFGRISEYSNFICRPMTACALNSKHTESLTINSDGEWEVVEKPEWCYLSKTSGNLKTEVVLTINELSKGSSDRSGKIVFKLKDTDVTTECIVSQFDYQYAVDECVTLQKASKGDGIDILFVGDGWDASSIADGSYLNLVNEQMEAFFGLEPYLSYRDRFNVYACITLSQETGVNTTSIWRNTRFSTFYAHDSYGNGSLQLDNADDVFNYAVVHSPLKSDRMAQSLVIMTLNSDEYGSATTITENGSAVAICSPSPDTYPMDTRGIIQHEACGHAFGKLAEERIVKNAYVSNEEKNMIYEYQWRGWYRNISLTGKTGDVHWSEFIFDPRYSNSVDVFEGAYGKTRGVYRAEINSCMNYGIPYFSAPARLDIMRRILEYSGEGFTMEKFYATDSDKWGSTGSTRAAMPDASGAYVNSGLHHPVRIVKSKKY